MKTIHEFLESKGIDPTRCYQVDELIKEYCSDLLIFCAENAKTGVDNDFGDGYDYIITVDKQSILKIKKLL